MWWAIFKYASVSLLIVISALITSLAIPFEAKAISNGFIVSPVKATNSYSCNGTYSIIKISSGVSVDACVMGNSTQIAFYYTPQGYANYGIKFPSEEEFSTLSICGNILGCSYSEENDTFVAFESPDQWSKEVIVYKDFVKNLERTVYGGQSYYNLKQMTPKFSTSSLTDVRFYIYNLSLSSNGKWLFVEARDYGFLRINTETKEIRRVISGTRYALGVNFRGETAISDDGIKIAVMGLNMGISVVTIDDSCGDIPSASSSMYFESGIQGCVPLDTSVNSYAPYFSQAYRPKFTQNSKVFSFDAYSSDGSNPHHITLFLDSTVIQNRTNYVAIGDSFSSGEGETDDSFYIGGPENACHVSSRSYPFLVASSWNVVGFNAACSGASMETARNRLPEYSHRTQLEEIAIRLPQVLTIGIGGNDAGLMGKLKACIGFDTCEWAKNLEERQNTVMEIKNLYPKLKQFYKEVDQKIPGKVIVVGYPAIISAQPLCLADVGTVLNQVERQFINEGIHYLNQVIQAAANDSGVEFVDVERAFSGSELCTLTNSPSMNSIRVGSEYPIISSLSDFKIIGSESFHPTPFGQRQIANAILGTFPFLIFPEQCVTCIEELGVPEPGQYWGEVQQQLRLQYKLPFISKVTISKGDLFEISLPAFSFEPSSDVRVELHSETQIVGSGEAADDGSFNLSIDSKTFEPGFHSIHLIGKTFSGRDVDIYDFLTIEEKQSAVSIQNIASGSSEKYSPVLLNSPVSFGETSPRPSVLTGVLGVSAKTVLLKDKIESSKSQIAGFRQSYILLAIGVSISVAALAIAGYLLYQRKKPRRPDG